MDTNTLAAARRAASWAAALAVATLAFSAASAAAPPQEQPAAPPAPAAAPKADRDGDKLFDDLEARLAVLSPGDEVDVLVRLAVPATAARVEELSRAGGFSTGRRFAIVDAFAATVNRGQASALARVPWVVHVEENSRVRAFNDTAQSSFGVTKARADAPSLDGDGDGSRTSYSKADLVAAVIDTGVDASHVELDSGKVIAFKDFVNGKAAPYDDNGHGTHVAATIAGDATNAGVAPGAAIVGVKVLDGAGGGTMANVTAAIDWVVQNKEVHGIEAINLSLGAAGCADGTDTTSIAVNNAVAAGLVVVAAAGNEGPGRCTIGSPGAAARALTVGAMSDLGERGFGLASFSSRGPTADGRTKPDIVAPGVRVTSAKAGTGNGYVAYSGTSMAAPFAAGVALLMKDAKSTLSPQQVYDAMVGSAVDFGRGGNNTTAGTTGADIDYGRGRLDAYAALKAAGAAIGSPPASPAHVLREGTLGGTGTYVDYPFEVANLSFPVAATLIIPSITGASASTPDFDLQLFDPSGAVVAKSETIGRQEQVAVLPVEKGTYKLRVYSYSGSGGFFLDLSAGLPVADTTAPATPTGLTATAGENKVVLDWADNSEPDLAGYNVYRRNGDGTWTKLASVQSSAYTNSSLTGGTAYTYRVTAYDTSTNEGAASAEVTTTPVAPPPSTTIVVGVGGDDGDVSSNNMGGSGVYPPDGSPAPYVSGPTFGVRRSGPLWGGYEVRAGLLRFDTSALPDGATVTSAKLRLHVTSATSANGRSLTGEWYPAGSWPIDGGDYTATAAVSAHSGTALTSLVAGSVNELTLQNLGSISTTAATALRLHVSGGQPSGENNANFAALEHASLPQPELVLTYTQ